MIACKYTHGDPNGLAKLSWYHGALAGFVHTITAGACAVVADSGGRLHALPLVQVRLFVNDVTETILGSDPPNPGGST